VSVTGLDVFNRTVHKTNAWLKEVMRALGGEDRHAAYLALRATLHMLRDRLTVEEVAQLGAQLPMLVRGFYYEGWDPTDKPVRERSFDGFLAGIAMELPNDLDPEQAARAVFAVLAARISEGEIDDVAHMLPTSIRALWPRQAA
jgi:uncharacterized protein (DUF2267 family)